MLLSRKAPRTNLRMNADAADMAADGFDVAPVVPTTNMQTPSRVPMNLPGQNGPQGSRPPGGGFRPSAGTSGAPSISAGGNQMMQGTQFQQNQRAAQIEAARQASINRAKADSAFRSGQDFDATSPFAADANALDPGLQDSGPTSGVGAGDKVQPNPEDNLDPTMMQAWEKANLDLLNASSRDTAEEERLLQEEMMKRIAGEQGGLNARLGASGFGRSGALSALSTDMRARAASEAAKGLLDIRSDAREELERKLSLGMQGARSLAQSEIEQQRALEEARRNKVLEEYFNELAGGGNGGGEPPPPSSVNSPLDQIRESFIKFRNDPRGTRNPSNSPPEVVPAQQQQVIAATYPNSTVVESGGGDAVVIKDAQGNLHYFIGSTEVTGSSYNSYLGR